MAEFLPYGRQTIEDDDVAAVAEALRADYLTTGPRVEAFEQAFAEAVGARHAVACSSGTAALQLALAAAGIGPGDEVIMPAFTMIAAANAVAHLGATPVLVDSERQTWNLDVEQIAGRIGPRTRAAPGRTRPPGPGH